MDIINVILRDHLPLKKRIAILQNPNLNKNQKRSSYEEFSRLLTSHAKAEEKTLYRKMKDYDGLKKDSYEGATEHAIANQLLQQINASPDDDEWLAKVKVVADTVGHHIEEEEKTILTDIKVNMDQETREELALAYTHMKRELDELYFVRPRAIDGERTMRL